MRKGVGEVGTDDISRILYFIDGINTAKKNSLHRSHVKRHGPAIHPQILGANSNLAPWFTNENYVASLTM